MHLFSLQSKEDSLTTNLFTREKIFQGAENSKIQLDFNPNKTLNLLSKKTILGFISNNRETQTLDSEQEVEAPLI